jgi:uncharacterized protein (DUF1330 family)
MAAYVIVDVNITDSDKYDEYRKLSGPSVAQYGGKFLVRGGAHETLEGDWQPGHVVILEFADADAARRWWNSPEYEAAKVVRRAASTARFVLVDGV